MNKTQLHESILNNSQLAMESKIYIPKSILQITGFIDLGKMGPADRWNDVAIAIRSLDHNASGFYTNGKKYFDFTPEMLLERLGIKMDFHKNKYYKLLDELF